MHAIAALKDKPLDELRRRLNTTQAAICHALDVDDWHKAERLQADRRDLETAIKIKLTKERLK